MGLLLSYCDLTIEYAGLQGIYHHFYRYDHRVAFRMAVELLFRDSDYYVDDWDFGGIGGRQEVSWPRK